MEVRNQNSTEAVVPAQWHTVDASTRPARSQAHENSHYRALPPGFTLTMLLEGMEEMILQGEKLLPGDRDTLEKVTRVVRTIIKTHTPEAEQ